MIGLVNRLPKGEYMQIKGLHKNIYRLYRWSRTAQELEQYRKKYEDGVRKWEKLKKEKTSDKAIQEVIGISRSTYFRHKKIMSNMNKGIAPPSKCRKNKNKPRWTEKHKQLVLQIRRENPTYGKAKIAVIIRRDFKVDLRESTVGRILKYLINKGLIDVSISSNRKKRPRVFKKHAKPWTFKDYNTIIIGERIQIDHMSVPVNGNTIKEFHAWDRVSKFIHANVYSHATSSLAKKFLLEFVEKAPFKIISIQVDGGSEFMNDFEDACKELDIKLIVLPPRKPKYNGGVERSNRIFREELYAKADFFGDTLAEIRPELTKQVDKYNTFRPHAGLNGLTPMQYIKNILSEAA